MHKKKNPSKIKRQLNRIEQKEDLELKEIKKLEREVEELKPKKKALRKINFKQSGEKKMPTDFSIVAGTVGTFTAQLTPPGGAQAAGTVPQWTSSDASVVLSPSPDGLTVGAAVPASDTAASFDLSISAQSADPAVGTVTNKHTITIVQPTPPALTAIDFVQTA